MCGFGISDVFKNEIVRLESMYSVDAHFGSGASPFLVKEALLFSKFREGLARESRDIDMDSAIGVNVWVMPSIRTYFKWGEILPNERSGLRSGFRGTDQDVRDVQGVQSLSWSFSAREVGDDLNDVRVRLAWVRRGLKVIGVILQLANVT